MYDGFDFEEYLKSGVSKLTHYCAAIVGMSDAEDAAQEAYIRLWSNLHRIPNEAAANVFLYRTAYRLSVDILRKRKRAPVPEQEVHSTQTMSDAMVRALMSLSPTDRAILYSRVVDECDYREIAARFSRNEAWTRKRYSLAKKKMEKILGKEFENE